MVNVLFLCTGNSARSVMAESYLNHLGNGFAGYSAGSQPTGVPNPLALKTLEAAGIRPADGHGNSPASKSWNVFAAPDADIMDVVITVCDNAAGEVCPVWPTSTQGVPPEKRHWSFPDPAAATGTEAEKLAAFREIFANIRAHIDAFVAEDRG